MGRIVEHYVAQIMDTLVLSFVCMRYASGMINDVLQYTKKYINVNPRTSGFDPVNSDKSVNGHYCLLSILSTSSVGV